MRSHELSWLVDPVSVETFLTDYWEQSDLLCQGRGETYYHSLFTLFDFDTVLSSRTVPPENIRVLKQGDRNERRCVTRSGELDLERMYQYFREGYTISLTHLHTFSPPLREMCLALAEAFSAPIQVNAYLTPKHYRGLNKHFDTHDVFVLQLHGKKRWRLGKKVVDKPLSHTGFELSALADLDREVELESGDVMYIPRGMLHDALSLDGTSLHITVGVLALTYSDIILAELEKTFENDSRFRAALPFGFASSKTVEDDAKRITDSLLCALQDRLSSSDLIENALSIAGSSFSADLPGYLIDLEAAHALDPRRRVMRRPGLKWATRTLASGYIELTFGGKVVTFEGYFREALQIVETADSFTADELTDHLDARSKLTIVKTLLQEGFLTLDPLS